MKRLLLATMLTACADVCLAQATSNIEQPHDWQLYASQLYDYDDIEDNDAEDMYEQMCELEASPIDINHATDDDIQRLFFLNDIQKERLTEYLDRYRPIRSMSELSLIESLDPLRLQLLKCFVRIENVEESKQFPSLADVAKYGKHEFVATMKLPLYTRNGDRNGYLGYKYKHWFRYNFKYSDYASFGFLGTQDAGEPFFAVCNKLGYDHYAYWLTLRKLWRFKTIALGQYKLRFGLGLVMNTGFSFGKTTATTMSSPTYAVTPNTSRSEAKYMQGLATTADLGHDLDATTFISYRKIDATLDDDGAIKTRLTSGYHRTESEIARRHNATLLTTGFNLTWHPGAATLGATFIYNAFNKPLHPDDSKLYLRHAPKGKDFINASINYGYTHYRFAIKGETAINADKALATLNAATFKATSNLSFTAIQRYYSYKYHSPQSSSFSDGGKVQNESGVYLSAIWQPLSMLSLTFYSDYAYHPWARYQVSAASHSWDNCAQAVLSFNKRLSLAARYRLRLRQEDYKNKSSNTTTLINKTEHRSRISLTYESRKWTAKTQGDIAFSAFPLSATDKPNSFGWMLSQSVGTNLHWFSATANIGYFHTDDYNSRLYTYERGPLYNFSFPMFYGEGLRFALFLRANIGKKLSIIVKSATTKYFDRNSISSSYQQINHSSMTDIDVQVKCKF